MWAPAETRPAVAMKWLKRQHLAAAVEPRDIFHPKVFGVEPNAVASVSMRVDIKQREAILACAGVEDAIPKPMAEPARPEETAAGVGSSCWRPRRRYSVARSPPQASHTRTVGRFCSSPRRSRASRWALGWPLGVPSGGPGKAK